MKVIVVSPFSPFPPYWGGASRIYNLVKNLNSHFEVTLLYNDLSQIGDKRGIEKSISTLEDAGVEIIRVPSLSRISQLVNPILAIKLVWALREADVDVVLVEFPWQGLVTLLASRIGGVPVVVDEHNAEFQRFERIGKGTRLTRRLLRWYESLVLRSSRRIYCVSTEDRDTISSEFHIDKLRTKIVPNGVDGATFERKVEDIYLIRKSLGVTSEAPLFLFHGKMDYPPNLKALVAIQTEILPRLVGEMASARIVIAGDNPPRNTTIDERIIVTGVVEDLQGLIMACNAVICPLESGGGTRIKIIEAAFCNTPTVSTAIGAEGLDLVKFGDLIRIADDWDSFVNEMERCVGTKRPRSPMLVESLKEYDWRYIAQHLAEDIVSIVND